MMSHSWTQPVKKLLPDDFSSRWSWILIPWFRIICCHAYVILHPELNNNNILFTRFQHFYSYTLIWWVQIGMLHDVAAEYYFSYGIIHFIVPVCKFHNVSSCKQDAMKCRDFTISFIILIYMNIIIGKPLQSCLHILYNNRTRTCIWLFVGLWLAAGFGTA